MRLTLDHEFTANGRLMMSDRVIKDVTEGIADPSDAIIPAETSLYRVAHGAIWDKVRKEYVRMPSDLAYASPWWSTHYDFNQVTWASAWPDQGEAARAAFAIHRGWGGDCSKYASIVTTTDLSVWYGLGRAVVAPERDSPQLSVAFASEDVLQIYIPGFRENSRLWTTHRRVLAFEKQFSNGRGFQGNLPSALKPKFPGASIQLGLFG